MPPRRKPARPAFARPRPRKPGTSPRDLERLFERAEKFLAAHDKHEAHAHHGHKPHMGV